MNSGKTVFSQLMDFLPSYEFRLCVDRYQGNYKVKSFSCWDQFLCLAFAQLTYRESLRDIEICLRAAGEKLYHMGIRANVSRNTLAHANEIRDWRIYHDFAQLLIQNARELHQNDPLAVQLDQTAYALDSTVIDLCLSLFPWAKFRKRKGAVKLHTLLDLRASIPTAVIVTTGAVHDVNIMDELFWEPGSIYVMDRGYVDFSRLFRIHQDSAFFVTRAKKKLPLPTPLLPPSRQSHRSSLRSNRFALRLLCPKGLSGKTAPRPLLRSANQQSFGLSDQQLHSTAFDYRPALPLSLAGGTVLQVDQATSSYQGLLWHQRQCREDSDLDRYLYLCLGGHRQKALEPRSQLVLRSTNFERDDLGENSDLTDTFSLRPVATHAR